MAETDKATAKELQRIRRLPENRVCPNCLKEESLGFGAVCMTFKTFICHDCKSAHQSFSHRCKSIQMSVWTMEEVKSLDDSNGGGNASARRQFLAKLPEKDRLKQGSSPDAYKRFVERAYIKLRWAETETEGPAAMAVEQEAVEAVAEEKPKRSRKGRRARGKRSSETSPNEVNWHFEAHQAAGDSWFPEEAELHHMDDQGWGYGGPSCAPYEVYPSYASTMASAQWHVPGSPQESPHENYAMRRSAASVSTASPPSAASYSAWSTPSAKTAKASLPLDPTNPWADDVLQLCEKHGHNIAGRFDLSPAMAGRSTLCQTGVILPQS